MTPTLHPPHTTVSPCLQGGSWVLDDEAGGWDYNKEGTKAEQWQQDHDNNDGQMMTLQDNKEGDEEGTMMEQWQQDHDDNNNDNQTMMLWDDKKGDKGTRRREWQHLPRL